MRKRFIIAAVALVAAGTAARVDYVRMVMSGAFTQKDTFRQLRLRREGGS
jgi:hypothetical protein